MRQNNGERRHVGGAFGKGNKEGYRNNDRDQRNNQLRREYVPRFPAWVNGFFNMPLTTLDGHDGIRVNRHNTSFRTNVTFDKETKTWTAETVNKEAKEISHFCMEIGEACDPAANFARVVCSPQGRKLPEDKLRKNREGEPFRLTREGQDGPGQILWQGLSKLGMVAVYGKSGKIRVAVYRFNKESKTSHSIAISEESYAVNMGRLSEKFYLNNSEQDQETLETEVSEAIKNDRDLDAAAQEALQTFIPAMALCLRKALGEDVSILDLPEPSDKPVPALAPVPVKDEAADQAKAAAEALLLKPKKSRRKKTGTDDN